MTVPGVGQMVEANMAGVGAGEYRVDGENKREREEITLVSTWIFILKDKCLIQFYSRILGFNKLQFKVNLRTHYNFISIYYLFSISIRMCTYTE